MEHEIIMLKSIIRNLDNRIKYLESRIKEIINNNDIYNCYICTEYCTYDDEKCDCNIFCQNYICKECISIIKTNKSYQNLCKNNKCNKWYCDDYVSDINNYIQCCTKCNIFQCNEHYESKNELKNIICKTCNKQQNEINEDIVMV